MGVKLTERRATTKVPSFIDPLSETLHSLRLRGSLYCSAELTAPWGVRVPAMDGLMTFQVVTAGSCWLTLENSEPKLLEQGDFSLLPRATAHSLTSNPDAEIKELDEIPVHKISDRYETASYGGAGPLTRVTYGVMQFDHISGQRLVTALPDVLHYDQRDDESSIWMQNSLRYIASEASALKPGGETVITRLADILVIQAIRSWLENDPGARQGWLAALRDKRLGLALAAMSREPERGWTVASLAKQASMSRSAFSAHFTSLVGVTPLRYLTEWRLQMASIHMRETNEPLKVIAELVGYRSEAAFSRAYKQHYGVSPASERR